VDTGGELETPPGDITGPGAGTGTGPETETATSPETVVENTTVTATEATAAPTNAPGTTSEFVEPAAVATEFGFEPAAPTATGTGPGRPGRDRDQPRLPFGDDDEAGASGLGSAVDEDLFSTGVASAEELFADADEFRL